MRGVKIETGQIISAPFLKDEAEVKSFEDKDGYYSLEIVYLNDREFRELQLNDKQVNQISKLTAAQAKAERSEDLFYRIEATRIRLAYQFDPLLAVNTSQIDPLPHQIDAVYHHALEQPIIRFLIADDPGAGKTIMAGLIMKELQYRQKVNRILIIAPGRLKYQWQREMREKFQTNFTLIDRDAMRAHWSENIWEEENHCVSSIDFIKQEDIRNTLSGVNWDLVIVDEAHKMAAYAYDSKEGTKVEKTMRYQVGEILSEHTDHYLFLTATPHKGDVENFRLFLDLLKPGFFASSDQIHESVQQDDNPLFIRRLKEDMVDLDGNRLFPPRHPQTVTFKLTPAERDLYNSVTRYVEDAFDQAKENRSISFALMVLQRRLSSSSYAILESLNRRRERLQELLELPEEIQRQREEYRGLEDIDEDDLEDMEEEERWEIEKKLEQLTIAENISEVRSELDLVEQLIERAERVYHRETESKFDELRDEILSTLGDEKLLVFTEFKDTLDYLTDQLGELGYDVTTIHGGMSMNARIAAEDEFRDEAQIMVATEAAGEGINLQFCSYMVNYDIPWNPNRLEQRMGRIHRYGQDREVYIFNMVSQDTREGQILHRLFDKLDVMKESMGSERVFDVLGDIIPGTSLNQLMEDAVFGQRRMDEIVNEVDNIDIEYAKQTVDEVTMKGLATRFLDTTKIKNDTIKAEESRLMPEYIEDFFLRAFEELGGTVSERTDYYRIETVPHEIRTVNDDQEFTDTYGHIQRQYPKITFDKEAARQNSDYEYIAPGHPLLEAVNEKIINNFSGQRDAYHVYGDVEGREGILWFVEGSVEDGFGEIAAKRVFCVYQSTKDEFQAVNPSILWDLQPLNDESPPTSLVERLDDRDPVHSYMFNETLEPFREDVEKERMRDAQIKEKYGLESLDRMLAESDQKLLEYQERESEGEDMQLAIQNELRRYNRLEKRREKLVDEIELEQNVTLTMPSVIGAAIVIPYSEVDTDSVDDDGVAMRRDDEVEAIAMDVAIENEHERGWVPEDVSAENLGFDVRSQFLDDGVPEDIRYIEVKGRAEAGEIRLSSNEWKKARRFGDQYWLYIVTETKSEEPQLTEIQDPSRQFEVGENIFATGFKIPQQDWQAISGGVE